MIRFYIDDSPLLETDPNKLLGIIFSSIKDIKFWSTECMVNFMRGTNELLKEFSSLRLDELKKDKNSTKEEKTRLTKFINRDIKIPSNRDKLIEFYFKLILVSEKKGLLPGFGMEGSLANPEYSSIYVKKENPKDE
jgi:hypothetical protein